jgi:hypothetical protein
MHDWQTPLTLLLWGGVGYAIGGALTTVGSVIAYLFSD